MVNTGEVDLLIMILVLTMSLMSLMLDVEEGFKEEPTKQLELLPILILVYSTSVLVKLLRLSLLKS